MSLISKIIAPVDFSDRCPGAARFAEALAEHYGAEVHMVHVIPPMYVEVPALEAGGALMTELFEVRKQNLTKELDRYLMAEIPGLKPTRVLLDGDPGAELARYANKVSADLIVMATHGYGPFRRFLLGSVTSKVLHDAHCPVWTGVHLEEAPAVDKIHFRTVVAAIDLGPQSEKTLKWAADFAKEQKAKLIIAHATPHMEIQFGEFADPGLSDSFTEYANQKLTELLEKAKVHAVLDIASGNAGNVVCDSAERHDADLVVTSRSHSSAIIRQSPCPVVTV
jgi:nucleotide-binding universal stress UspA family protein